MKNQTLTGVSETVQFIWDGSHHSLNTAILFFPPQKKLPEKVKTSRHNQPRAVSITVKSIAAKMTS